MSAANAARNTNARSGPSEAAKAAEAKPKAQVGAYTRDDAAIKVTLFIERSDKPRAPVFGGTFGSEQVQVFARKAGTKDAFLSFMNRDNEQVATANVRVRKTSGAPALKTMVGRKGEKKTVLWISLRKEVDDATLAFIGADMDKLAERETAEA